MIFYLNLQSYREFHADLFPDTYSGEPAMTSEEWFQGENKEVISSWLVNPVLFITLDHVVLKALKNIERTSPKF